MSENAVEEVREFLEKLPQRSPQEAIGMRDEGGLMQGMILGAALLGVLTLLGTAVPFLLDSFAPKTESASTKPATANEAAPASPDKAQAAAPATDAGEGSTTAETAPPAASNAADPDRVLDSLGIGEAKEAAPNVNPRESDLDNLLDGVK